MNKVILMGRLTKDPETRFSAGENPVAVARYTLAVDRIKRDEADFISVVAFGKAGEFADKYFKKGMKVAVSGRIQTGSYTNKDGKKVYTTDVLCDRVQLLESRGSSQSQTSSYQAPEPQDPYAGSADPAADSGFNTGPSYDIASDDLPF